MIILARLLGWPFLKYALAVFLLVESVFLVEKFEGLMIAALRYEAPLRDFWTLLVLETPEIAPLALSMGALVGLYFAVTSARDNNELVILAGAGISAGQIIFLALFVGLLGGALVWPLAGYIAPKARYTQRILIADMQFDYLNRQFTKQHDQNMTLALEQFAFVITQPQGKENGTLFFFDERRPDHWSVGFAGDWQITSDGTDQLDMTIRHLESYSTNRDGIETDQLRTKSARFSASWNEFSEPLDTLRRENEQTLFSATAETRDGFLAETLGRALQVVFAALISLCAVVAPKTPFQRVLSQPVALVVLFAWDVATRSFMTALALPFPAIAVIAALVILGPPLLYLFHRDEALMHHRGFRS